MAAPWGGRRLGPARWALRLRSKWSNRNKLGRPGRPGGLPRSSARPRGGPPARHRWYGLAPRWCVGRRPACGAARGAGPGRGGMRGSCLRLQPTPLGRPTVVSCAVALRGPPPRRGLGGRSPRPAARFTPSYYGRRATAVGPGRPALSRLPPGARRTVSRPRVWQVAAAGRLARLRGVLGGAAPRGLNGVARGVAIRLIAALHPARRYAGRGRVAWSALGVRASTVAVAGRRIPPGRALRASRTRPIAALGAVRLCRAVSPRQQRN